MNWKLLLACVAICGCCTKSADVALARRQNPAMARYADVHDCHPWHEIGPVVVVEEDGSTRVSQGDIFYTCPEHENLIMLFTPENEEAQ